MRSASIARPGAPAIILRTILPLVIALAALAVLVPAASAGEEQPEITFRIVKLDCEEDPGQIPDGLTPRAAHPPKGSTSRSWSRGKPSR